MDPRVTCSSWFNERDMMPVRIPGSQCKVGYFVTATVVPRSRTRLVMLSQVGCCIQDAAAAVMAAPPKKMLIWVLEFQI